MSQTTRDPVADELTLRDLLARAADAITRRDVDAVAELFVADGEWVVSGYGEPRGRAAIRGFLSDLLHDWTVIVHALLSGRVHLDPVDPDRATGRWYVAEFGQRADGTEVFFSGVYHDTYVRDAGIWRFARRRYDSLFRRVGSTVSTSPFPDGLTVP